MELDARFWAGKRVCVTGGTGFLGWNLIQALLPWTCHVRVFGLPPTSPVLRSRLTAWEYMPGDVRDQPQRQVPITA
jgi:nucleoside-diphosphate-sugar epimerase